MFAINDFKKLKIGNSFSDTLNKTSLNLRTIEGFLKQVVFVQLDKNYRQLTFVGFEKTTSEFQVHVPILSTITFSVDRDQHHSPLVSIN